MAALLVPCTSWSAELAPDRVVYPTGAYPLDMQNVQEALDRGGIVLLKATNASGTPTSFNFGPSDVSGGWVEFRMDAELSGERAAGLETVIEGGWYPVRHFGAAVRMGVRNISFDSSFDGALLLFGGDTAVTGNRASHVVGRFRQPNLTFAEVFVIGFSARAQIEDNVIDDVAAELAIGISQFRAEGPVAIRGNTISDTGYGAIESSFNVSSATGMPAAVSIVDNRLRPGPAPDAFGVGIEINGEGAYHVARNDILIESPFGLGVYALGAPDFGIAPMLQPVIEKNLVQMQPPIGSGPVFADGIDLVGVVSGAYVGQNTVKGTAFSALGAYNVIGDGSDLGFNTYVGNQIGSFDAIVVDLFLDTAAHDTVLTGLSGTVIDLGSNNQLTGAGAIGRTATIGRQLQEATRLRSEAMQATIELLRQHGAMR